MKNKKGQDMSLTTIILIVLGVAILVFLIFGFSSGWGNLWGKIQGYIGGGSNIDTVISGCQLACSAGNKYDFCESTRTVKFGKETQVGEKTVNSVSASCKDLATNSNYTSVISVADCPGLCS